MLFIGNCNVYSGDRLDTDLESWNSQSLTAREKPKQLIGQICLYAQRVNTLLNMLKVPTWQLPIFRMCGVFFPAAAADLLGDKVVD